jgi:hypothetical protein
MAKDDNAPQAADPGLRVVPTNPGDPQRSVCPACVRPGVLFLLNQERVILEMLQLARMHMAKILKLDENKVRVSVEVSEGRLHPKFEVDQAVSGQWEVEYVQGVIREVWEGWARDQLNERLRGLREERIGCARRPQEAKPPAEAPAQA